MNARSNNPLTLILLLMALTAVVFIVFNNGRQDSLAMQVPAATLTIVPSPQSTTFPTVEPTPSSQATIIVTEVPTTPPAQQTVPVTELPMMTLPPGTYAPPVTPNPTEQAQVEHSRYLGYLLWEAPGTIVGQSNTPIPNGTATVTARYEVEEVTLPEPINFSSLISENLPDITVEKLWRVSIIQEEPFEIGAYSWSIWLNGVETLAPLVRVNRVTGLVFERSFLQEGATIEYGILREPRLVLPEALHISTP